MREMQSTRAVFNMALKQAGARNVFAVTVALGEIAELEPHEIEKHWKMLSKDTPLEHAQFRIRFITAEAQCMACFKKYHPMNGTIHCPHCGSFGAKILSGEEFHVELIETDDQ